MKDLKRVQIVSADTAPHSIRVLAMDGDRLHGISALDVRARPNEVTTATVTMMVGTVNLYADAKWYAQHPVTGEMRKIKRIEFEDDTVLEPNGPPKQNTLVVVGWLGIRSAYLNVSREEAIVRWMRDSGNIEPPPDNKVEQFTFSDEFGVYDAWGLVRK